MKNERQFIKVKAWFIRKLHETSGNYNCWISIYNRNEDGTIPDDVIKVLVDEVLSETEKAVQVNLATGDVVGSAKGWKTWLPKSVIVNA